MKKQSVNGDGAIFLTIFWTNAEKNALDSVLPLPYLPVQPDMEVMS